MEGFIGRYLRYFGLSCELLTEEVVISSTDFIITDYDLPEKITANLLGSMSIAEPSKKIAENVWVCSTTN